MLKSRQGALVVVRVSNGNWVGENTKVITNKKLWLRFRPNKVECV
jgi:hypothetical protein